MTDLRRLLILSSVFFLISCGKDKNQQTSATPNAANISLEEESTESVIDATSEDSWTYFSLEENSVIDKAEAAWELAFMRTNIKLGQGVQVAIFKDKDFAEVTEVPASEDFIKDEPSDDPAAKPSSGLAFHSDDAWYSYNPESHVVTAREYVYVIQTAGGHYYKLQMTDYYDEARSSGYPTFVWAQLATTEGE